MELSANNYLFVKDPLIRRVNLSDPEKETLANVLDEALKRNYTKASVQWVTSHPDLSQPPFNLAAPGICGNTALLDFGDMSYLELPFFERKMYNFKQFLKNIGRANNDSFIFGHGVYRRPMGYNLKELVLNTSFLPSTNEKIESRKRSRLIHFDANGKCNPKELILYELECTGQGTYFLCDGSRTNASVLEVRAKGPLLSNVSFQGCKRFINSMQEALEERFGSKHFVALGGVYKISTINNVPWKHRLYRNNWESSVPNLAHRCCRINAPETMITIFNSSTELHPINLEDPIKLNSCQSMHSLSHHSASVNFPVFCDNWEEEYLGYFCPATTLYRIDELPQ